MRRVVLGIAPILTRASGGIYQYSVTTLDALRDWEGAERLVVFVHAAEPETAAQLRDRGFELVPLLPPRREPVRARLRTLAGTGPHRDAWRRLRFWLAARTAPPPDVGVPVDRPELRAWFESHGVDLMLYPAPSEISFEAGVPYVMAIHDLQHRLQPEFPEVAGDGQFEFREYIFRNGARRATLLLADSTTGLEDIVTCYGEEGVRPERIRVVEYVPPRYTGPAAPAAEVRERYRLPDRYVFYPAQFWEHKNHSRLVGAVAELVRDGLDVPLVLCGANDGMHREPVFRDVLARAEREGVANRIHYLGLVPDADMPGLYENATVLAMPTFFGPSNLPILEAWEHGTPVVTSDIRGVHEQAGDAALLADPRSVAAIADAIRRVWVDPDLASELARRGQARLAEHGPREFAAQLHAALADAVRALGAEA